MAINRVGRGGGLLFLLNPFSSIFFALKNYRADWAKNFIWGFCIFYGVSFVVSPNSTADSVHYANELKWMSLSGWNINHILAKLYVKGEYVDLYQPLLTFIVSRFTDNYNILFGLFGFVLGYFYSRNIWLVITHSGNRLHSYSVLLMFLFAFIIPISDGINGVRMWTGAHVFIFGFLTYILDKNKRGLLIAVSAVLFHWSYLYPLFIFLIYYFAGPRVKLYYILFIISFFVTEIDLGIVRQLVAYITPGQAIDYKISSYIDERTAIMVRSEIQSTYLEVNFVLFKYSMVLLTSYLALFRVNTIEKFRYNKLFSIALLFFTVFNVLSSIPSVGRFLAITYIFLTAFFILYTCHQKDKTFMDLVSILSPVFIFYLIVQMRYFLNYIDLSFFLGNIFINGFLEKGLTISEMLF